MVPKSFKSLSNSEALYYLFLLTLTSDSVLKRPAHKTVIPI